jgi:transposase-like protein
LLMDREKMACVEEKMNFRKAAQFYNVPSHTVYRRARKLRETQ